MGNFLLDYMTERFKDEDQKITSSALPFITISRLHGCKAKLVADLVVKKINASMLNKKSGQPWRWISKEILESAAKDLNVDHDRVLQVIRSKWHNAVQETISTFIDKYYKYDRTIINTIDRVISDFAMKGNVVIVGRAGLEVTQTLNKGFHVSLTASPDWRLKQIMENEKIKSKKEAGVYANIVDGRRLELRKKVNKGIADDSMFHITYNCEYFDAESIADSIIYHLKIRE